jgi:hypothetical protein
MEMTTGDAPHDRGKLKGAYAFVTLVIKSFIPILTSHYPYNMKIRLIA